MDNRIALGVISVFVVLAVIGSALTPMIDAYTTTTTTIENEGAVGLRMDKVTSGDFTLTYGLVGDDFTATNGTDAQIIDDMCIFYADDNVAVWMDDSSVRMLGKNANDQTIDAALSDEATITITKSANGVIITDGTVNQIFPVPAWSYVPKSTGTYGFFLNETEINTGGLDVHYVGSFAGVNCYDSINSFDLPLALDATVTDSTLTGAKWIKAAAADPETELNPDDLHIIPLDPSIINPTPEPDVSIMAVPTPTYTDGDWGYDLVNGTTAKIVSYSGTGGDITIPSTVGGYPVTQIGKDNATGNGTNIMTNAQLTSDTTVTIPDSVTLIGAGAFKGSLSKLIGINLPDGVTIGRSAFLFSGLKSITVPDNSILYGYAFQNCSQATTLTIGDNVKMQEGGQFKNCYGLDGTVTIPSTTTYGPIGGGIFEGCNGVDNFIFPEDMIECYTQGSFFYGCSSWVKDDLVIYDGVPSVGYDNFNSCTKLTGKLVIPESVKNISSNAFYYCSGFDTLISLMDDDSVINSSSFSQTRGIKTILNLGSLELTTTSYGLNADEIRTDIPALGYLAAAQYSETVTDDSPMAALLKVIPLITIIAVVIMAVGVFIAHRME